MPDPLSPNELFIKHHQRQPHERQELLTWWKAYQSELKRQELDKQTQEALRRFQTQGAPGGQRHASRRRQWTEADLEELFARHNVSIKEKRTQQYIKGDANATVYAFSECRLRAHTHNEKDQGRPGSQGQPTMTLFSSGHIAYYCFETECAGMDNSERLAALAESLDEPELRPRKSGQQIIRELEARIASGTPERGKETRAAPARGMDDDDDGADYDDDTILESRNRPGSEGNDHEGNDLDSPSHGAVHTENAGHGSRVPRGEHMEAIEKLIEQICTTKDITVLFEDATLEQLATLAPNDYLRLKAKLAQELGTKFPKRDFETAVKAKHREASTTAEPRPPESGLPEIIVNDRQLRQYAGEALKVLEACPEYYERGNVLVRIRQDPEGEPFVDEMQKDALQSVLTDHMDFYNEQVDRQGKVETRAVPPPANVANYIYNRVERHFRPLYSIARVPIVRPDGTIVETAGYDPVTRLLYMPAPLFEQLQLPDAPTQENAREAATYVAKLFQDFPFVDQASRANMLALVLTSVVRPAISGCVPLALIDATQPGSGKGLLAKVVALIATGKTAGMETLDQTDSEMRKKITSILVQSRPLVCFDNVASMIYHDSLAAVLTADTWSDRLLGMNKHLSMPNRVTWMATGNTLQLGGDIARRCYLIRMNPKMARPETRTAFRFPDLQGTVLKLRVSIVGQILIWAKAWVLAGKPAGDLRLGSFEHWAFTIGGMLKFAGVDGFLENRDVLYEERDTQGDEWSAFLRKWRETFGGELVFLREVIGTLDQREEFKETLPLSVLQTLQKYNDATQKSKVLGKILSGLIERRYGDLYLRQDKKKKTNKPAMWAVWSDTEPNHETRQDVALQKLHEHFKRPEPGQ